MTLLSIIIASFNRGRLLEETLRSIKDQRCKLSYEIVIADNMSTDCTEDVISRFASLPIVLMRECDSGLYAAIAKGLTCSRGEYLCYINCGDIFDPYFFSVVERMSRLRPHAWYIGLPTSRNENYETMSIRRDFHTSSKLIKMGYHNGRHDHFLQQESIFWHKRFNKEIDNRRLASFRLAGDAYMWLSFARLDEPVLLGLSISGYTHHTNPLSDNRQLYRQEYESLYAHNQWVGLRLGVLSAAKKVSTYLEKYIVKAIQRASR